MRLSIRVLPVLLLACVLLGCRSNKDDYTVNDPLMRRSIIPVYGVEEDEYVMKRMPPMMDLHGGKGELKASESGFLYVVNGVTEKRAQRDIQLQIYKFQNQTAFDEGGGKIRAMKPVSVVFADDKAAAKAVASGSISDIEAAMAAERERMNSGRETDPTLPQLRAK